MPPQNNDQNATPPAGGQPVTPVADEPMGTPAPVIPAEPETSAPMGDEEAPVAPETPAYPNQPAV